MEEREKGDDADVVTTGKGGKSLERLGHIKTLPRSEKARVSGRKLGGVERSARKDFRLRGYRDKDAVKSNLSRKTSKMQFLWDLIGVTKKPLGEVDDDSDRRLPKTTSRDVFSTDDEPLDEQLRSKVDQIVEIEDAFLLNSPRLFKAPKISGKRISDTDAARKDGAGRVAIDLLNPANNPLLTDPDSLDTGGLTKNDRIILKALRWSSLDDAAEVVDQSNLQLPVQRANSQSANGLPKRRLAQMASGLTDGRGHMQESRGAAKYGVEQRPLTVAAKAVQLHDANREGRKLLLASHEIKVERSNQRQVVNGRIPGRTLGLSASRHGPASHSLLRGGPISKGQVVEVNTKWGKFPGIDPSLSFSGFIRQFLTEQHCTLRVFLVWTTPLWSYSVRNQRGLESFPHFHPKARVVVFSEALDSDLSEGFAQNG
eukprot:TRINITY_DN13302_c0_g3_i1.p1 TRINITY_DN13302_c0_g3~~TRINITY_DN13302_c0_g3_i1.p1  ORF type:complete len:476 (+),score=93.57 TRINITY_DN13302_c0_g3_i1:146-1429(+)